MAAPYLGDYSANAASLCFIWNTNTASGLSVTRSTDGALEVWKNPAGPNQASHDWSITDTEDLDGLIGSHACGVNLASAWYAAAHDYSVVLRKATIDTHVVHAAIAHFSIENRAPIIENGASIQANYIAVLANGATIQLNYDQILANGATVEANNIAVLANGVTIQLNYDNIIANGASLEVNNTEILANGASIQENNASAQLNYIAILANGVTVQLNYDLVIANGVTGQLNYDLIIANGATIQENYDSLETDTLAELSALPAAAPKWKVALTLIYMAFRNASLRTASEFRISNDAGAVILEADLTDDDTTFTKSKLRAP